MLIILLLLFTLLALRLQALPKLAADGSAPSGDCGGLIRTHLGSPGATRPCRAGASVPARGAASADVFRRNPRPLFTLPRKLSRHERARSPLGLAKVIAVMATNVGLMRLKKELKMLYEDPPPGISAWAQEENFHEIEAGAAHIGISVRSLVADQHADC